MSNIKVDFSKVVGDVKPMHAVNNGPSVRTKTIISGDLNSPSNNFNAYKDAGIPYARTHDASFFAGYGSEHTIDVYYVFPNFDADPTDPNNYDFACTDEYLKVCEFAGTEVFYRLGHRIEHEVKKYGAYPPKDFKKWAIICEHIIRHYTEGWANGYNMKITYWEIWNEPDLGADNPSHSPTWQGTKEQYFELYNVTASHLKSCFPHLKIGGPALAHNLVWADEFLAQLTAPLDFFSWHIYAHDVEKIAKRISTIRDLLDKHGYTKTESILNEWNYVLDWSGEEIIYSHEQKRKEKGASFTLATMCASQYAPIDMLMYYDARPRTSWNGMFDDMAVGRVLKGYYPFPMFNTLYRLGSCVEVSADKNLYLCGAKNDEDGAVAISHFNDDDNALPVDCNIDISGFGGENGVEVEIFVLDKTKNLESAGKITYYSDKFGLHLNIPNFTSYLLKLRKK